MSESEIKDKELNQEHPEDKAAQSEKNDLVDSSDSLGKGYSPKRKVFWSKKKKSFLIGTIILATGSGGLFMVIQGPLQIISIAQNLQRFHFAANEQASSSRMGRLYEYLRTTDDKSRRNLGYFGEKLSDRYLRQLSDAGIEIDYRDSDGRSTRRIQRMSFDPSNREAMRQLQALKDSGVDVDFNKFNNDGDIEVDFRENSANATQRRQALQVTTDLENKGRIASAVQKRVLAKRAGVDFHPLRNARRDAGEKMSDFFRRRQQESAERNKKGSDGVRVRTTGSQAVDDEGVLQVDENGEPIIENSSVADEANAGLDEAVNADTPDARRGIASRLLRGGGAATAIIGVLCVARNISEGIDEYQRANIILPMVRMAMEVIATGSQIMTGQDVNLEEVGAVVDTFYDEENQTSIASARAMQAVNGEELTGPDSNIKPSDAEEKPVVFEAVDAVPGLGAACSVQEGVANFISGIPLVGDVVGLAESVVQGAIDGTLSAITGKTTEDFINDVIAISSGDIVETDSFGAERGNYIAIGGRLAANESMIASGGAPLTSVQSAALRQQNNQYYEGIGKSYFARYLDTTSPDSFIGNLAVSMPSLNNTQSVLSSFVSLPKTLVSMFANILTPQVVAAEEYDFGVDAYGFSLEDLDRGELDVGLGVTVNSNDPYEVADYMEENDGQRLNNMNEKYSKCFGTSIDPDTGTIKEETPPSYETASGDECSDDEVVESNKILLYRIYLLDMFTFKSAACYEGVDEQACDEVGFNSQQTAEPNSSTTPVGDPYSDSTSVACASGTNDLGIHEAYIQGQAVNMRLCGIPNITSTSSESVPGADYYIEGANGNVIVNSRMSGAWLALVNDAIADGINLSASSTFRTMAHQESLWRKYGMDTSRVARPGYSGHQAGVAIDFANMDGFKRNGSCSNRATNSSDRYQWLRENAANYGIKQYAKEAWHWDALPVASRC